MDTPGFNDTEGYKQDACNLYSIKQFYEKHPKLSGCYPNLIFVLVPATDPRIAGDNSNLAKSLRCLKEMRLVDSKHPNVIGVLTWAAGLKPKKKWTEKVNEKKRIIKDAIFKFLNVAAEVIPIENAFEDEELEEDGEWTVLPDDSRQPMNLFEECTKVLIRNKDYLGNTICTSVFGNTNRRVNTGFSIPANDARVNHLNREESQFAKFFEKTAQGNFYFIYLKYHKAT